MRTAMRPRYYCDHCNKGNGSPSAMRRHERGCTLNPQRVCGMCKMIDEEGGPDPAPPRDQLVAILNAQGFRAMCEAANDCPACILSVIRTLNYPGDEEGPGGVSGPADGRESWNYDQAKQAWWADWNSAQAEQRNY
jgi:hypothetical protein